MKYSSTLNAGSHKASLSWVSCRIICFAVRADTTLHDADFPIKVFLLIAQGEQASVCSTSLPEFIWGLSEMLVGAEEGHWVKILYDESCLLFVKKEIKKRNLPDHCSIEASAISAVTQGADWTRHEFCFFNLQRGFWSLQTPRVTLHKLAIKKTDNCKKKYLSFGKRGFSLYPDTLWLIIVYF